MDKRQAIRETKTFWKTILEGRYKNKEAALRAPEFAHISNYPTGCPLCEYVGVEFCKIKCPLWIQLGHDCHMPYDFGYQPRAFAAEVMKLRVHVSSRAKSQE